MPLPDYLSWTGHGSSCGEPPGVFTGGTMHLFVLAAQQAALQALADRFLKPVAEPNVVYTVPVGHALLTMLDIEKGTAAAEAVGWLPGQECALWIPLVETSLLPPRLPRLVMWSPYIFISYAIGMATGREVWGWSKALGRIDIPPPGAFKPRFALSTVIFPTLDASKPGGEDELLTVTGDGPMSTLATWTTLQDAADAIFGALTGTLPGGIANPFAFGSTLPAIALKQFRDAASPHLACYQAIVNSPVHITTFGGGGLHTAKFDVAIKTCASHPIAEKFLGIAPPIGASTVVTPQLAAWVKFDFEALPGSVIRTTT